MTDDGRGEGRDGEFDIPDTLPDALEEVSNLYEHVVGLTRAGLPASSEWVQVDRMMIGELPQEVFVTTGEADGVKLFLVQIIGSVSDVSVPPDEQEYHAILLPVVFMRQQLATLRDTLNMLLDKKTDDLPLFEYDGAHDVVRDETGHPVVIKEED